MKTMREIRQLIIFPTIASFTVATLTTCIATQSLAQARPLKHACLNSATGQIINRTKCKRTETRFSSAAYNGRIDTVSNSLSSLEAAVSALPQPARILHVASSGAPYNTISSALLASNDLGPSAANPVLIKVAPGTYPLPADGVSVPDFVHLEGSGAGITQLTVTGVTGVMLGNGSRVSLLTLTPAATEASTLLSLNTENARANAEHISIEGSATSSTTAITNTAISSSLFLHNIRIALAGSSTAGFIYGIYSFGRIEASNVEMNFTSNSSTQLYGIASGSNQGCSIRNSSVEMTQTGNQPATPARTILSNSSMDLHNMRLVTSSPGFNEVVWSTVQSEITIDNSYLESSLTGPSSGNGVVAADAGSTVQIRNSTVITTPGKTGISAYNTDSVARVANSFVSAGAGVTSGGGTVTCAGVTDENYTFYASSCPS